MPSPRTITQLLIEWNDGDKDALARLMPLVYTELHSLAQHYLQRERADHTLQATGLVHEAYLRLVDQTNVTWQNRAHFFGIAANLMRQILVDHARKARAAKRDAGYRLSLNEAIGFTNKPDVNILLLDEALKSLASLDPQQSRIVELRFFGGLTVEETAEVVGVSPRTVKRLWRHARAWLHREISRSEENAYAE